jgi:hypothetical protein
MKSCSENVTKGVIAKRLSEQIFNKLGLNSIAMGLF